MWLCESAKQSVRVCIWWIRERVWMCMCVGKWTMYGMSRLHSTWPASVSPLPFQCGGQSFPHHQHKPGLHGLQWRKREREREGGGEREWERQREREGTHTHTICTWIPCQLHFTVIYFSSSLNFAFIRKCLKHCKRVHKYMGFIASWTIALSELVNMKQAQGVWETCSQLYKKHQEEN